MQRRLKIAALTLLSAFTLAALLGFLPLEISSIAGPPSAEAFVRGSDTHHTQSVPNQQTTFSAVAAHGAGKWHEAGFTGTGVKVGIIDFGFQDLPTHPLSGDIEGQLCFEPRSLGGTPSAASSDDLAVCQKSSPLTPPGHGTLSVEAVHLFAPDAEVYITNPTEPIQIPVAVDWLIETGVDVIIRTHGWSWEGAGDGKAFDGLNDHPSYKGRVANVYSAVNKAADAGIVWAQGMGSAADITWSGAFSDPDGDGWHNFSGSDECNDVDLKAYPQIFYPWLRWDDEVGNTANIRNLDIYLLSKGASDDLKDLTLMTDAEMATFSQSVFPDLISFQSNGARSGKVDQSLVPFPLEIFTTFGVRTAGTYCLAINNVSDTKEERPAGPEWMQMQLWQAPEGENTVEYKTPDRPNVSTPADSANDALIAVAGASDPDTLLTGSGQGPTRDDRTKPDGVALEIALAGGHIEAAAVAGALAALVKDRYQDFTPAQVAEYMKTNAADRAAAGPDNAWGHGFLLLPDDVEPTTPDPSPGTGIDVAAVHGADKWHGQGFTGAGVKIGVIDFGFGGIEDHIGTEVPDPMGVRCYSFNLDPTAPPSFTSDLSDCDHTALHFDRLHGASVLEAVYDLAPEADYYVAAVSQFSLYHTDLKDAVDWMIDEGVDIIAFSHVGAWSGPGDGTSLYPTSELKTLNRAVENGITWISPAGDRARDTWSGRFTDSDGDNVHEFRSGITCNDVDLSETDHPYRVQLRWDDEWRAATRDFELSLFNKSSGQVVATSQKAPFAPNDPNELLDFTTPDTQASYCLRLELKTPTDEPIIEPIIVNMQSYGRHGLSYPTLFGSITSPGENTNDGALTVGAAPVGNTTQIQPFSGRGPMNSRQVKPDLVGADDTHSAILGRTWQSTSLSAAHVAGLAALVKQRFPGYTPEEVAAYLIANADPRPVPDPFLGPNADPNNTWGHGFAMLPDDVEGVTPPVVDTCFQTIDGSETLTGTWSSDCVSNKPAEQGTGDRYARFYTFTLDREATVNVDLTSEEDTYLYLMEGEGKDGTVVASNDDVSSDDRNSRIADRTLSGGTYTIEATTFAAAATGEFTLTVQIDLIGRPPDFKYIAISSGANHVCAIATDGSIMCWGNDDYGQVSDRPRSGSFMQISSGDNHTCALREDGAVICWGSFDVP